MNWSSLVASLRERGLTQGAIAERCGVRQSSISALATGATKNPNFELGRRLEQLAKELQLEISPEEPQAEDPPRRRSTDHAQAATAGEG